MKIVPNKIWFKVGTKFISSPYFYEILEDRKDCWYIKDYGRFGYISSCTTEFEFEKYKILNLYNQGSIQIL